MIGHYWPAYYTTTAHSLIPLFFSLESNNDKDKDIDKDKDKDKDKNKDDKQEIDNGHDHQ